MFKDKTSELFTSIGESKKMVLATSANNRVTARAMSIIVIDNMFYFQTDKNFLKYKQMMENSNIALCFDNIQIEAKCKDVGHPLDDKNKKFTDLYKSHYARSYDAYSKIETETVFECEPILITLWEYEKNTPYREIYNFIDSSYCKDEYKK